MRHSLATITLPTTVTLQYYALMHCHTTAMALPYHFHGTAIPLQYHFYGTAIPLLYHFRATNLITRALNVFYANIHSNELRYTAHYRPWLTTGHGSLQAMAQYDDSMLGRRVDVVVSCEVNKYFAASAYTIWNLNLLGTNTSATGVYCMHR